MSGFPKWLFWAAKVFCKNILHPTFIPKCPEKASRILPNLNIHIVSTNANSRRWFIKRNIIIFMNVRASINNEIPSNIHGTWPGDLLKEDDERWLEWRRCSSHMSSNVSCFLFTMNSTYMLQVSSIMINYPYKLSFCIPPTFYIECKAHRLYSHLLKSSLFKVKSAPGSMETLKVKTKEEKLQKICRNTTNWEQLWSLFLSSALSFIHFVRHIKDFFLISMTTK